MTQTARKGKLYQLQYLIDLSSFIISYILVFGPPTPSIQQNSYTAPTPLQSGFGNEAVENADP